MVSTRAAPLWVVAAVGYLVLEAFAAAGFEPAYSYARDYISDLGLPSGRLVRGRTVYSPRGYLIHAAFYLQGILFSLGASLIVGVPDNRRARVFLGAVAGNAVGNVVIGTVHSGTVHVDGAALAILGGNAAILTGPDAIGTLAEWRWYRLASKALAALGFFHRDADGQFGDDEDGAAARRRMGTRKRVHDHCLATTHRRLSDDAD